jgi:hypothetical protein
MGHKQYSDEELLAEIRRLSHPDDPVSMPEMRENGRYGASTIKSRFGSWNEALRTAGVGVSQESRYSTEQVLVTVQEHVGESGESLSRGAFDNVANLSASAARNHCGTWWKTLVRAGCYPYKRRPFKPDQYKRFHEAALDQSDPVNTLIGLLNMFTGIPAHLYKSLTSSWFDRVESDYETIISIPPEYTLAGQSWDFVLPESFTVDDRSYKTHLPDATRWCIQTSSKELSQSERTVQETIRRIAKAANIGLPFKSRDFSQIGSAPNVSPSDLRATLGVQMARQGAPRRQIRRHLGIEHTGWNAQVDDFFLWLFVREGYEHPDYDPPDVVLDPV